MSRSRKWTLGAVAIGVLGAVGYGVATTRGAGTTIDPARLVTIRALGGSQRVLVESLVNIGFRPQAFTAPASAVSFSSRDFVRA